MGDAETTTAAAIDGGGGGNGGRRSRGANKAGRSGTRFDEDAEKTVRSRSRFLEGAQIASECSERPNTSTRTVGGPKYGGMFPDWTINSTPGANLYTGLRVSRAPTAKITTTQSDRRPQEVFWVDDSGASESMDPDATGFETYELAPPRNGVERANSNHLPVPGYRGLRLMTDQEASTFQGKTQ